MNATLQAVLTAIIICGASGALWSLVHFAIGLPTVENGEAVLKSTRNIFSRIGRMVIAKYNYFEQKEVERLSPLVATQIRHYTEGWTLEEFEAKQGQLAQYEAYARAETMRVHARPNPFKAAGVCFICFATWGGIVTTTGLVLFGILPTSLLFFYPAFSAFTAYVAVRMRFDK